MLNINKKAVINEKPNLSNEIKNVTTAENSNSEPLQSTNQSNLSNNDAVLVKESPKSESVEANELNFDFEPTESEVSTDDYSKITVEEVMEMISDSEQQMIQAILDMVEKSIENSQKMLEEYKEYLKDEVIPREQREKKQAIVESVQEKILERETLNLEALSK